MSPEMFRRSQETLGLETFKTRDRDVRHVSKPSRDRDYISAATNAFPIQHIGCTIIHLAMLKLRLIFYVYCRLESYYLYIAKRFLLRWFKAAQLYRLWLTPVIWCSILRHWRQCSTWVLWGVLHDKSKLTGTLQVLNLLFHDHLMQLVEIFVEVTHLLL